MKISKLLLYLNLFFLQSYLIRFDIGGYPSNLLEALLGLTLATFLIETIVQKHFKKFLENLRHHWILTVLLLLTFVSVITVTPINYLDFLRHLKFLFFATLFVTLFLGILPNEIERKKGLIIAGLGALTFGIFSVIFNLSGFNVAYDLRLTGPLDSAVYLATYLAPFFIFFFTESCKKSHPTYMIPVVILLGLLLLATRSMGAIGATFLVGIFYLFKKSSLPIFHKKISKIALAILGIFLAGIIFYSKILPALQTDYASLNERGEIWKTSFTLLKDPEILLFGSGFGQFQEYYFQSAESILGSPPLDLYVLQPHNLFLTFWFNFGLLGLIFILFIIALTLKNIFRKKNQDLTLTASLILLYFFIHGLIDTPWFKNDILFLLMLFLQIGLPYPYFKPETKSNKAA